jgi:endonuclease III
MAIAISKALDKLEFYYGKQQPSAPTSPYEFLVWWHCGYPASEDRCSKGWESVAGRIGIKPHELLSAKTPKLALALKPGGMIPALRAARLREIAQRTQEEFAGNLGAALARLDAAQMRKILKSFPGIGNPGADRVMLFGRLVPTAAVPSSSPHVLVRLKTGRESGKYVSDYADAQHVLEALPVTFDDRIRAFLLLNRHAQQLCKRSRPACGSCPLEGSCAFARASSPGG